MSNSHDLGPLGTNAFRLHLATPGNTGLNDPGSPDSPTYMLGDALGAFGASSGQTLESHFSLDVGTLHTSLYLDTELSLWDYDPERLLENSSLNARFVDAAHVALYDACRDGLRPRVHEAYRTPQESDRKHKLWKAKQGGRASPAWKSCHNYGIAMDVWLYDRQGRYIDNHVKGWYRLYKQLGKIAIRAGFVWGEGFGDGDADHFEFHPKWSGGAGGKFLGQVKDWAMEAAMSEPGAATLPKGQIGPVTEPEREKWLPYFWWAAGASKASPPTEFLASNVPPAFG